MLISKVAVGPQRAPLMLRRNAPDNTNVSLMCELLWQMCVRMATPTVHHEYMALAKTTSVLREAMLLSFEAFEIRIAKSCKQQNGNMCPAEYADIVYNIYIKYTLYTHR